MQAASCGPMAIAVFQSLRLASRRRRRIHSLVSVVVGLRRENGSAGLPWGGRIFKVGQGMLGFVMVRIEGRWLTTDRKPSLPMFEVFSFL